MSVWYHTMMAFMCLLPKGGLHAPNEVAHLLSASSRRNLTHEPSHNFSCITCESHRKLAKKEVQRKV